MTDYRPEDYSEYRIQRAKETILFPVSEKFIHEIEKLITDKNGNHKL